MRERSAKVFNLVGSVLVIGGLLYGVGIPYISAFFRPENVSYFEAVNAAQRAASAIGRNPDYLFYGGAVALAISYILGGFRASK